MRARLVNQKMLSGLSARIGLPSRLVLGKGEKRSGGGSNPRILACVFEALIGALYLDQGLERAKAFVEGEFVPFFETTALLPGHFDFKPELQALSQRLYKEAPKYNLLKEEGPAHKKEFLVQAVVDGKVLGRGRGATKKEAEQLAAAEAVKRLRACQGKKGS
jgi:ribonuclease-3